MDIELIEKTIATLGILSACVWKLIDIFTPLFAKVAKDDIRAMLKTISAGIVGWGAAWAFGIQTINVLGYSFHPALDAIIAGLLCSGGSAVFSVLFDIVRLVKEFLTARRDVERLKIPPV